MIKDKPFGNPMTQRETFESFYTRKLEGLKNELKSVIKGDLPFVTSDVYACKLCACRIKLHSQGQIFCMMCIMPPSLMPFSWSKELKTTVFRIMTRYPSLEAAHCEWEASQTEKPAPRERRLKTPKLGDVELGEQIREARLALGLSKRELASKIFKSDGKQRISAKSIEGYENGYIRPQERILEQIKTILKMNGWETWDDIERDLKG